MKHDLIPARNAQIVEAYKRSVPIDELASFFDLSESYVVELLRKAGVTVPAKPRGRRPGTEPIYAERNADIVRRAEAGEDFTSIARDHGLTRERVRQIVERDAGKSAKELAAERAAARQQARFNKAREIADAEPDATVGDIAARSGLSVRDVELLLGDAEAARRRPSREIAGSATHADVIKALRRVAALPGAQPLTRRFYDANRRDGEEVSSVRIMQMFGTWVAACTAAAVVPHRAPNRTYSRSWTREDCLDWVADFLTSTQERPTFLRYEEWARSTDGAPSGQTVRNMCGKWTDTVRDAYTRLDTPAAG